MKKTSTLDWIAGILVVIGALNWGLVGFFHFNLVAAIFGPMSLVSRIIYAVVGVAGIWMIFTGLKCCGKKSCD